MSVGNFSQLNVQHLQRITIKHNLDYARLSIVFLEYVFYLQIHYRIQDISGTTQTSRVNNCCKTNSPFLARKLRQINRILKCTCNEIILWKIFGLTESFYYSLYIYIDLLKNLFQQIFWKIELFWGSLLSVLIRLSRNSASSVNKKR